MSRQTAPSVARRVALWGAAILTLTLALVGVSTGAILHVEQREAQDRLLLAAALGNAHPPVADSWRPEHLAAPVQTWIVRDGDPRVPPRVAEAARQRESAVFADVGDLRMVLLVVEGGGLEHEELEHDREGEHGDEHDVDDHDNDRHGSHLLVAAAAPAVTVRDSLGAFAPTYAAVGALAALAAALALWASVRAAFAPLERSRREAADVVALGQGKRLTESGPVEIRSLLVALNALLDRLDTAYAAQGRFTAEAAHELRTPVTSMLGELEVALRHPRSAEEYRGVLESAHEEVQRLASVVSGLTALARLDAGHAEGIREPVRAAELVRSAVSAQRSLLTSTRSRVRVDSIEDPELLGHRSLLEIALGNLIRNAATHAPGGTIDIHTSRAGDLVVFDVDDSGPGVAEDAREVLFDRFVRGPESRLRDRRGMGLGLPIARQVARRHGGDCTLLTSPSGGLRSRLTVRLHANGGNS